MKLHFYKDAIYDFTAVIETKGSTFPVAYVERAKAYMEMGDYQKAVKDLDKALKRGGSSQEFNVAAADLYFRLGKYDSAKPYIQKAIMGNPHDAELYFLRAKLFYKTKDANQAVKDLKKSFTIDPNHNESKRQLAWIYSTNPLSKYRDAEKAVEIAEELYGKNQDVDYAEVLAAAYAEAGEYQKAVNVLKENMNKTDNLVVRDDFRVFMKFYNEKKNIRTW
jgi:tetratricopeptide (TPR) repeat protein